MKTKIRKKLTLKKKKKKLKLTAINMYFILQKHIHLTLGDKIIRLIVLEKLWQTALEVLKNIIPSGICTYTFTLHIKTI